MWGKSGAPSLFSLLHPFVTIVPTQPGEEDSELSRPGDGEPWKESEQKSDMLRFESDHDHSDCCVLIAWE